MKMTHYRIYRGQLSNADSSRVGEFVFVGSAMQEMVNRES